MRRKLLAFIMLVCLAIGTIVPQAGAEGTIEVPENQAPMQVDDQQLPLPDAAPSVASATYGMIKLGSIDGYSFSSGYAYLWTDVDIHPGEILDLLGFDGDAIDLRNLTIEPEKIYKIELEALYRSNSSFSDMIVYFDEIELSGRQLLDMTAWPNNDLAVQVVPNITLPSDFTSKKLYFRPEGMTVPEAGTFFDPSAPVQFKVMMKPGKLNYTVNAQVGDIGYAIRNTVEVAGDTTLRVGEDELRTAVEVTLPANDGVQTNLMAGKFAGIRKLHVTPVDNRVLLSLEENATRYYLTNDVRVTTPQQLTLASELVLEYDQFHLQANRINARVELKRGDFLIQDVIRTNGQNTYPTISSKFYLKDEHGARIQELQSYHNTGWTQLDYISELSMPSGRYELETVVTVNGHTKPYSAKREFIFVGNEIGNFDGITISAQDEQGQPLKNGQVFLYERSLPDVSEVNNGITDFYSYLAYQGEAQEPGKLLIPSKSMVAGKEYELVVVGASSNGQAGGVYYHQTIAPGESKIDFTKDKLKRLIYTASSAVEGDTLNLAVKRSGARYLTWPISVPFNSMRRAEVYVGTSEQIVVYGVIYPLNTTLGYYLSDERSVHAASSGPIDLTADLAIVQPPEGFEDASLSIGDSAPRSSWYVSKGVRDWFYYSVSKDGYRYTLKKYTVIDGNKRFSFGKQFKSSDTFIFWPGKVIGNVYSNFYDEQDSLLYDVAQAGTQMRASQGNELQTTPGFFSVHSSDGKLGMIVEQSGDSFVYQTIPTLSIAPPTSGGGSSGGIAPMLVYQLYDDRNQPVGEQWYTDFARDRENWTVPSIPGKYTMKLEAQMFPDNVAKLEGEMDILVYGGEESRDQLTIPITLPSGYVYAGGGMGQLEIRTKNETGATSRLSISFDKDGKLLIHNKSQIMADKNYVVLLNVPLFRSNSEEMAYYYSQLRLTGHQLLALEKIDIPGDLVSLRPDPVGLPKDATYINSYYLMPVEGYATGFRVHVPLADELLVAPGNFSRYMTSTNGTTIGYGSINRISIDPLTKKITITDVSKRLIQFKNSLPFMSFYSSSDTVNPWFLAGYDIRSAQLLNKLMIAEGNQWLFVDTLKGTRVGPQWVLSWRTRDRLNIEQDMTINFEGLLDSVASTLNIVSLTKDEDSKTQLVIRPELLSGSMKLMSIAEVRENFPQEVPARIEIKDSVGTTQYLAKAMYWNTDLHISKMLPDGQYTLTFSLPVGPNEEFKLTKSFTVGDDTVAPTVPTGLRATETDATSVTLAWNPSTDAFGVAGYRIYIGGSQVGTTSGATAYKVTGLTANTPYSFMVKAYDAKSNLSAASQSLTVRTACAGICGGIGGGPMPFNSEDENTVTLTNRDVPAASDGKISIDVKDKTIVVLPARITELVGKNDLEVRFGDAIVSLPPEVLAQLSQLQSTSGLSDASMRLTAVQLNPAEVQGGLASDPSTEVAVFSPIYELKLAVVGKNGEEKLLSSFKTPITVRFPVNPGADRRLTGIYYIADNGKLEYIGGRWEGNELVAELSHFSKYGVFEIKKNFEDVAAKHWALSVIQELAAKQIVNGITDTKFAPEKKVTRSEFAAMLVKALRLKPAAVSTAFEDVPRNAWYSEAVAAAYAHGLIKGLSDSRFAPQEQITREQMAIMVMNAYQISLKTDSSEAVLEFKDSGEISKWAQTSVTEAGSLGLMKGRNGNLFAPKDNASRAEAVQVISNLLQQLSQ